MATKAQRLLGELEVAAKAAGYQLVPLFEHNFSQPYLAIGGDVKAVTFDAIEFLTSFEGGMKTAHEVGHIARGHRAGEINITDLPEREEEAWGWARDLFARLELPWDEGFVKEVLADYRRNVSEMILCGCGTAGEEVLPHLFLCPACERVWGYRFGTSSRVRLGTLSEPSEEVLAANRS